MEPKLVRYLHDKATALNVPINGTFELTARCNFNCAMCYVHLSAEEQRRRGRELTGAEWIEIAEQAKRAGTVFLLLTGGEPLIHPDFEMIYRKLKTMGFMISINSNASLIQGEMLELFRQEPPYRLNLTLYAVSNAGYERQCGVPCYDRVLRNIQALRNAGINLRINLTITPTNRAEMPELVRMAKELGAVIQGGTYLLPPIRVDGAAVREGFRPLPEEAAQAQVEYDRLRLSPEEFSERAQQIARGAPVRQVTEEDCELGSRIRCRAGRAAYWIDWQGNMMPCAQLPTPSFRVLPDGFDQAWRRLGQAVRLIRLPKECVGCPHERLCNACAAKCYSETGRFDVRPDYVCRFTHTFYEAMKQAAKEESEE